jgi:hypothetical protein
MKKSILWAIALVVFSVSFAFAEASFDQIQELIKQQNYSAAISGLEGIIQNHPKSAKAFYAMSQAQAGIGNQVKAKEALDKATGLDPKLEFAPSSNVERLKEAIQPQTQKIQAIESHTGRNILIALFLIGGGIGAFFIFRKKKETPKLLMESDIPYTPNKVSTSAPSPRVVDTKTVSPSATDIPRSDFHYTPISTVNRPYRTEPVAPVNHTTVVNNGGSDMLTGVLVGSMLNNNHSSHHDHHETRVVEREVIREVPAREEREERSSSWDTPKAEERSSSWDTPSETTRSSSWDSDSSSSSSSSWDSGSSSSSDSSSSSSSWD